VRVITAMVGPVDTLAHANLDDLELPSNSYYQSIVQIIDRLRKHVDDKKQDSDVAARNITNDILSGRSGYIWRGNLSTMAWMLTTFLPGGLLTSMINQGRGLSEICYGRS